ncbi:hypothetical protein [Microbacterium sp. P04]|uniref:hypothetical protein n=1 Tax=Microbacterium sp. P04 TaxID=3366947 RepID=UPI0037471F0E
MSDEPRLSPERREAMQNWLKGRIRAQRRRRRGLAITGAVGGGVAVLGLVAWMVVAPQEVQDRWVDCYAAADTGAPFATAARSNSDAVEDRNAVALAACGELWRQGLVDGTKHSDAPEFVLCQRTDLSLAAYPLSDGTTADGLCSSLGQKPPTRGN